MTPAWSSGGTRTASPASTARTVSRDKGEGGAAPAAGLMRCPGCDSSPAVITDAGYPRLVLPSGAGGWCWGGDSGDTVAASASATADICTAVHQHGHIIITKLYILNIIYYIIQPYKIGMIVLPDLYVQPMIF